MTNFNGYTNYETWNFVNWELDYLQEVIQDLQDQTYDKLEYGQVYEVVNGHLDQIIESQELPTTGFLGDIVGNAISSIDIHQIATNIHEELEFEEIE